MLQFPVLMWQRGFFLARLGCFDGHDRIRFLLFAAGRSKIGDAIKPAGTFLG